MSAWVPDQDAGLADAAVSDDDQLDGDGVLRHA